MGKACAVHQLGVVGVLHQAVNVPSVKEILFLQEEALRRGWIQ